MYYYIKNEKKVVISKGKQHHMVHTKTYKMERFRIDYVQILIFFSSSSTSLHSTQNSTIIRVLKRKSGESVLFFVVFFVWEKLKDLDTN